MRILVLSDVHANLAALLSLASDLHSADYIVALGDWVGYHHDVNEVIDYIRQFKNLISVLGNHDDFLLRGCPATVLPKVKLGIEYADQVIRSDNRTWLKSLPMTWAGLIGDLSFYLVHGSPWQPLTDYLYADNPKLKDLDAFHYDFIAFGQTHRAYYRNTQKPFLINPGSVGQSRDKQGRACAMWIETSTLTLTPIEKIIE